MNQKLALNSQKYFRIEDRFVKKDISVETFNITMTRYQANRMNLNADIERFYSKGDSITEYIDNGLNMLLNLNNFLWK